MSSGSGAESTSLNKQQINQEIHRISQRYRSLIDACLSRLLALPVGQALYVLDCLCNQPNAILAARLHAINLNEHPNSQIPMLLSSITGAEDVQSALESLINMVPQKDRDNFWLALAIAWIQAVPRRQNSLDDPFQDKSRVLKDDEQFRNYLRSELMGRLAALY